MKKCPICEQMKQNKQYNPNEKERHSKDYSHKRTTYMSKNLKEFFKDKGGK